MLVKVWMTVDVDGKDEKELKSNAYFRIANDINSGDLSAEDFNYEVNDSVPQWTKVEENEFAGSKSI